MIDNHHTTDLGSFPERPHFEQAELGIVLDFCAQPILFIDTAFHVYYLNFRALSFFHSHQDQFKICDPAFDPNVLYTTFTLLQQKLVHRYEEMQSSRLGECLTELITVHELTLELRMIPIFSIDYERLGTCVEIHDKTELVHLTASLEQAIQAAECGQFDKKMVVQGISAKYLAFQPIHHKLNTLFEKIHNFFGEFTYALEHLVNGNFSPDLVFREEENIQENIFASAKKDFNYAFQKLYTLVKNSKNDFYLIQSLFKKIAEQQTELAVLSQKEKAETHLIEKNLIDFFGKIRSNFLETQQALEVANALSHNYEAIDALKTIFNQVRRQLQSVLESTKYMHYVFRGNLAHLRGALNEIEMGNIGKGITVVTEECELMIARTNTLMYQIQTLVIDINQNFDEKHQTLENLSLNMNGMMDIITLMSTILAQIQDTILNQDSRFDTLQAALQTLKVSQETLMTKLKQTDRFSDAFFAIHHDIEDSFNAFAQSLEMTPEEKAEMLSRIEQFLTP